MEYKFFYINNKTKPEDIAVKRKEGYRVVDEKFKPKESKPVKKAKK